MTNTMTENRKKTMFWKKQSTIISTILLCLCTVIFIFPFVWAVAISLLDEARFVYTPEKFFKPPFNWGNWAVLFKEANLLLYTKNTLIITGFCILGTIFSNSFVAFGFARYKPRGMELLFTYLLATMFVPGVVMSIPSYIIWSRVGALDTYIPLILPSFFSSAMNVFLLRQTFRGIPNELAEAAYMDGMGDFGIWWKIYFPLSKPMIAFMTVQCIRAHWNNFMGPLIYINDTQKHTLMLGVRFLSEKYAEQQNIVMAASIAIIIPVLILYVFAQKQFVAGLASGAVKG